MSSDDEKSDEVEFAGSARRDLQGVPPRIVPAIIEFVYGDLARCPRRVGNPLQRELEGLWSARRGPDRIIYDIVEERLVIIVVQVDHRADVYRPR
ncbi:type II toxin-antitoxin system RelE/ParE family toxin [Cryobacterium sp. Hh38]|uniref:type II toxin-antitoxin system RelE family toxin n=1 Tax=Cryobacterium sp. Hh38 TaxID=1259156 RepID=UPI00106C27CE|nr:type II toxin-antitoxin system RelE/ParE family toxin [Cryobacterium sp. Hh38]TFD56674.1 type II toxin-antitoxin system RelE/ParE family toxin [Cryobacterium sp. Hh38]